MYKKEDSGFWNEKFEEEGYCYSLNKHKSKSVIVVDKLS